VSLQSRVVVVGGGIAGCSAALALAGRGVDVTLIESSNRLGGRFKSVEIDGLSRQIDPTQNVIFRTYSRFLQLLATCDKRNSVRIKNSTSIPFLEVNNGKISYIESGKVPPPNHLSGSFVNANFLGLFDKISLQKALKAIQNMDEESRISQDDISFLQWLQENGQTKRAIDRFWNPICKMALNIDSSLASASSAIFLIKKVLFGRIDAFDQGCFTTDFTNIISSSLRRILNSAGVEVHLSTSVTSLFRDKDTVTGVNTKDEVFPAKMVILCTPITATARLLTGSSASHQSHEVAEKLTKLGNTSQIGIHAFHGGPVLPVGTSFVTCCDEPLIQMLFDRSSEIDDGNRDGLPGHWICSPVAFADAYLEWDDELIKTEYERVINSAFPEAPGLLDFHIVRIYHSATSLAMGSSRLRPNALEAGDGVILGGDWINIDWPSCLEASTRAGLVAASTFLKQNSVKDFTDWQHDDNWPDWPLPPDRGDKNWRTWD